MFCPKCGTDTGSDSFCRKCGAAVSGTNAPAPPKKPIVRPAYVFVLVIVLALFGWYVDHQIQIEKQEAGRGYSSPSALPAVIPALHTMRIGQGALSVPAAHYTYYTLSVPAGAHNVRTQGHFQATGGSGNDIEVVLLNEEQFTNWKNRHETPAYYNSGKVTVGDLQASLPDDVGTYYLVFNNNFSLLTAKAVEFNGTITYFQ